MNITFDGFQAPGILLAFLVAGFFWGIGNAAAKGLLHLMARFRPQIERFEQKYGGTGRS